MSPDDKALAVFAEHVARSWREVPRSLLPTPDGPRSWSVEIKPRDRFEIRPPLTFTAESQAIVFVYGPANLLLGIEVRDKEHGRVLTRGVGHRAVSVRWNSGSNRAFIVRVFNLSRGSARVTVETNG